MIVRSNRADVTLEDNLRLSGAIYPSRQPKRWIMPRWSLKFGSGYCSSRPYHTGITKDEGDGSSFLLRGVDNLEEDRGVRSSRCRQAWKIAYKWIEISVRIKLNYYTLWSSCTNSSFPIHAHRTFLTRLGSMILGFACVARMLAMAAASHAHTLVE